MSYDSYQSYHYDTEIDQTFIPITPFPFEVFPPEFRKLVEKVSRSLNVMPELTASIILATCSGAIGNTTRISPKSGWEVPLFLWIIIIAISGYGKTPAIDAFLEPIQRMQGKAYKEFQQKLGEYNRNKKKDDSKSTAGEWSLPVKPKLKHYIVSDTTIEALSDVFEETPRGVIIHRDELSGLMTGLNQYKNGKGNDRQHYIELFDARPWKVDRKTAKRFIPNTGASIIGGIQPIRMPEVFRVDGFDDGLLPRFLLLHAHNKPLKFNREGIEEDDLSYWKNLLLWCYELPLTIGSDGFVVPKILSFSDGALDCWEKFYNECGEIIPLLSYYGQVFVPKIITYSLKFTGLLHVLKACDEDIKPAAIKQEIDEETVLNSVKLTRYYAGQNIKSLSLYKKQEPTLTEFELKLIKTLYELKGELKNGRLPLSRITEVLNKDMPSGIEFEAKQIGSMLRKLGLEPKKSTGNLSFLIWEPEKMEKLFEAVTTVTTVTPTASPGELIKPQEIWNYDEGY